MIKERLHYIYGLKVEGTEYYFYIGYTNQNPNTRLIQHIKQATQPSEKMLEQRLIQGGPNAKDKIIIDAVAAGKSIIQDIIEDAPLYEELDELSWIQYYKSLSHPITNIAIGQQWQKQYKDNTGKVFSYGKSLSSPGLDRQESADTQIDIEFKSMMIQQILNRITPKVSTKSV